MNRRLSAPKPAGSPTLADTKTYPAEASSPTCGACDQSWSDDERARAVALFRALGHEGRLQILLCLSSGEGLSVSELLQHVGGEQSSLSHQLRLLKEARLVRSARRGRHNIYALYDRHVSHVVFDTLAHVREESHPQ